MKKTMSVLVAILMIVSYSCKEKVDYEKEKKAVLAVMEEETAAYYSSDFGRWAATYLQDSTMLTSFVGKSGSTYYSGWKTYAEEAKSMITGKKNLMKEVKTPGIIKVYGNSAWITFDDEIFDNKGESIAKATTTCFLEKQDGKWKIVYRNVIQDDSYFQPDLGLLISTSYAKSMGKKTEDLASFTGDLLKTGWTGGYEGFQSGMLSSWATTVPKEKLTVLEKDNNHIVFTVGNVYAGLKAAPQFNVSYDEYLNLLRSVGEKIADYVGAKYNQESNTDGVKVTISRK
jgi:hypothetical protein